MCLESINYLLKTENNVLYYYIIKMEEINNVKEEMFWFEFDGNKVKFLWNLLEPSIASWVFLMYERMKKKCSERNRADKANRNTQKAIKEVTAHMQRQKQQLREIVDKMELLKAENKAMANYINTHK